MEVAEKLRALPQAEVSFNYLGQVDQAVSGPPLFARAGKRADRTVVRGAVGVICWKSTGVWPEAAAIDWTYSEHVHRRATIERLAQGFIEALRTLIAHCQSPEAGGYTPSDFPEMRLSQQELDELMTPRRIGRRRLAMTVERTSKISTHFRPCSRASSFTPCMPRQIRGIL